MAEPQWKGPLAAAKRLAVGMRGVTGIDFGYGYKEGVRKRRLCIRFHVERKLDPVEMQPHEVLPSLHMGLPCDVVQGSYGLHLSPKSAIDPLMPGVSIGNLDQGTTGTLGALVMDKLRGRPALLSNWHVFCAGGVAGNAICQPGPDHAGSLPARRVASLERWLNLSQGIDAALAVVDPGSRVDSRIFGLNQSVSRTSNPEKGMRLVKMSAVSEVTSAMIDGIDGSYRMNYSYFGDHVRWMDGFRLVRIPGDGPEEISLAGDSGGLWVNPDTNRAVGLHFAGEDGLGPLAEYAIAHPINRVLELLDAELMDGIVPPQPIA